MKKIQILSIVRCLRCLKKKINSKVKVKNKIIICIKCKEVYPMYEGVPVLISKKGDFHHLRRALLPAKYRISYKI